MSVKKSAIQGGKVQELLAEGESDLDPSDKGYHEMQESEIEEDLEEDLEEGKDDEDEDEEEAASPSLDAGSVNKKFKLLPEEVAVEEDLLEKLNLCESEDKDKVDEQQIQISESFSKLFEGDDSLTKEFKEKAASIFEAAVNVKAKLKNEAFKKRAIEVIKEHKAQNLEVVVSAAERMFNHFSNHWFKENRIAIVDDVTVQLAEGQMRATKDFLSKFNVRVPRSKENLVEKLSLKNAQLRDKLDASLNDQMKLQESLDKVHKNLVIQSIAEGLSDADKEKFVTLAEEISFTDSDSLRTKLTAIKEGVFDSGKKKSGAEDFASKMVLENKKEEGTEKKLLTESSDETSSFYLSV